MKKANKTAKKNTLDTSESSEGGQATPKTCLPLTSAGKGQEELCVSRLLDILWRVL